MKLLGILVLLFVCLVFTVKAQQLTSKSTTSKTNATSTVKPKTTSTKVQTTTKTNATTTSKITQKVNVTTTSKLTTTKKTSATTTLKPKATTTVKRNVTTTTPSPVDIPKFFVCRDTNSSAATGILQPYRNITSDEAKNCQFSIVAPPGQKIQITCSTINIIRPYYSGIAIAGSVKNEYGVVVNRDYYSINNNLSVTASFDYSDWFECKWKTLPKENNTTNFKLCLHSEAKTANGTIQSLRGDTDTVLDRICSISIVVPSNYQIEFTCSSLNVSGYLVIRNGLDGSGNYVRVPGEFYVDTNTYVQVLGRKYYSITNNVTVESSLGYQDWFNCSYKAIPKEITTESKFCRHAEATAANGTISPIVGDTRDIKNCAFNIRAPPYQQIRIICSVILLASPESYLTIFGANDDHSNPTVLNRTYYSTPNNDVTLMSYFGKNDWISCQWTTTTRENTTNLQMCRDNLIGGPRTANGTIQPMAKMNTSEEFRSCSATISAPDGYQIQLSCSTLNMASDSDSYFRIDGILDIYPYPLTLNRVYTSNLNNKIMIFSVINQSDWFYCKWNIAFREITQNSKLCLHAESTVANGTITPLAGNTGPMRTCYFTIKAPSDRVLQLSCSTLNFSTPGYGYFMMSGIIGSDLMFVNRVFTATTENEIQIFTTVDNGDWFVCKWTTTPKKNTTDFKLCRDEVAISSSGTIQPLVGDTGPTRVCYFSIQTTSFDQQTQLSCSAIKLNNSYLEVTGVIDSFNNYKSLVLNRIYTSTYGIKIESGIAKGDWIDCKWTTIPVNNSTDYKFCRDWWATTANGTIQPLKADPGPSRDCSFSIYAPPNQQIRISCSTLNLTSPESYLGIYEIIDIGNPPVLNRVYYSSYSYYNRIDVMSGINKGDWIDCKWTTIPEEITPNSKLCRHRRATMSNGTITPLGMTLGEPKRECEFNIKANLDQQIQFSCSTIRLSSGSYLNLYGMIGQSETDSAVTLNRVYYSTRNNDLRLSSKVGSSDTFNCTWATIPLEITSQFKLCRHAEATAANGTITPITGDKRSCFFHIKAYPYQKIQISCSVLKLTSTGSYLSINGLLEGANSPVLNRVYTSTASNEITLSSSFDKTDTFNCSWTITPRY